MADKPTPPQTVVDLRSLTQCEAQKRKQGGEETGQGGEPPESRAFRLSHSF